MNVYQGDGTMEAFNMPVRIQNSGAVLITNLGNKNFCYRS